MEKEKFKQALYSALIPEYAAIMREADDTPPEFSPGFEKRMKKLIKRRNKPFYKLINTVGKRVACIAVIFLVASSVTILSVKAIKEVISSFSVKNVSIIQPNISGNEPQTIEELYDITYDLSDYRVAHDSKQDHMYWKYYRNTIDDYTSIELKQYVKKSFYESTYPGATVTLVDINGHDAFFYSNDTIDFHYLIWDNGDYIIRLKSNVDKNTLIEIAESVQKVENE